MVRRLIARDTEDGWAFDVTHPVDLAQFVRELTVPAGQDVLVGAWSEGDASVASEDEPVVIWVNRRVDPEMVERVLNDHEVEVSELEAMRIKARAGQDLTDGELQRAVRLLLLR